MQPFLCWGCVPVHCGHWTAATPHGLCDAQFLWRLRFSSRLVHLCPALYSHLTVLISCHGCWTPDTCWCPRGLHRATLLSLCVGVGVHACQGCTCVYKCVCVFALFPKWPWPPHVVLSSAIEATKATGEIAGYPFKTISIASPGAPGKGGTPMRTVRTPAAGFRPY